MDPRELRTSRIQTPLVESRVHPTALRRKLALSGLASSSSSPRARQTDRSFVSSFFSISFFLLHERCCLTENHRESSQHLNTSSSALRNGRAIFSFRSKHLHFDLTSFQLVFCFTFETSLRNNTPISIGNRRCSDGWRT